MKSGTRSKALAPAGDDEHQHERRVQEDERADCDE
jgi:hypothetical protein